MSRNRVIWSEGLFLRPQHFQQMERSVEMLVQARSAGAIAHPWGFSKLVLDDEALKIGRVSIKEAAGRAARRHAFFDSAGDARRHRRSRCRPISRMPSSISPCRHGAMACPSSLSKPAHSRCWPDMSAPIRKSTDAILGSQESAAMRLGRLNLRYAIEGDPRDAFCTMGLARVVERRSTGAVVLDDVVHPADARMQHQSPPARFPRRSAQSGAASSRCLVGPPQPVDAERSSARSPNS